MKLQDIFGFLLRLSALYFLLWWGAFPLCQNIGTTVSFSESGMILEWREAILNLFVLGPEILLAILIIIFADKIVAISYPSSKD